MEQQDIAQLEARIQELEDQQVKLQMQVTRAELDQWEGRIDDLDVQLHLGAMDVRDQLGPLLEKLRDQWLDANEKVGSATSTTGDVLDTLRGGLEQAMKDIRQALVDARTTVTG